MSRYIWGVLALNKRHEKAIYLREVIKQKFKTIGEELGGVSANRARQIYREGCRRRKQVQEGDWKVGLTVRQLNTFETAGLLQSKEQIVAHILNGKIKSQMGRGAFRKFGMRSYLQLCKWASIPVDDKGNIVL